ncbi:MAG: HD domain-containing protein [Clostridia bacterium]
MSNVTFDNIRGSEEIKTYIEEADHSLVALGYTEHSYAHVLKCAAMASSLLKKLGYSNREAELAEIAAYMHDIGNVINRADHAQSGAIMAFRILDNMGMDAIEIAKVITAIGNHDEKTAFPVNAIAAALILADKTDVRRSRVRNKDRVNFDIHDRVNYAATDSFVTLELELKTVTMHVKIDTGICAVMDYFEIFIGRMLLCRKAAEFFNLKFKLNINGSDIM